LLRIAITRGISAASKIKTTFPQIFTNFPLLTKLHLHGKGITNILVIKNNQLSKLIATDIHIKFVVDIKEYKKLKELKIINSLIQDINYSSYSLVELNLENNLLLKRVELNCPNLQILNLKK